MAFYDEGELRKWLRRHQPTGLFWIEPAAGSTVGMPDSLFVQDPGIAFWFELKIGREKEDDWLKFTVRKAQEAVIGALRKGGQQVFFLVMEDCKAGNIWAVPATDEVCAKGLVRLTQAKALLIGNLKSGLKPGGIISWNVSQLERIAAPKTFPSKSNF